MHAARALILRHRALAAALFACAMLLRLLVPVGYMPVVSGGTIRLELCAGVMPVKAEPVMHGMHHGKQTPGEHPKAEQPCAFAGLSMPSLGAADPLLLAAALLFAFLIALRPASAPAPRLRARLRPPLRAPPAFV
ncbi:DUF2946 family protein [Sphingomonas jatrophae]|uniref:DUF2946 domain-containing protein n=1 Tax=Sphingomonas jatrophae TaxID=1166337 RepID=A0A1I6JBB0_9SPHN|nr:DUF2946 family protein [Sphingomonas jatrophae]SFR76275.1 hypothetical protein SAMN05192580_0060 [Sphingomonas jatrophae]